MWLPDAREKRYLQAAGLLTFLCLGLFFIRHLLTGHFYFSFIPGNLFLAWMALVSAWVLTRHLRTHRWSSWQNLGLTFIWLAFLPNTWYVLTDFIHVFPTGEVSQIFDIVLISSLVFSAFLLGFTSLYLVHKELIKRLSLRASNTIVLLVILIASFAIYLGRDLRWNTWDVITNPGGLILNVSDRVIDPFGHPRALNVTLVFFMLLSATYFSFWLLSGVVSPQKTK